LDLPYSLFSMYCFWYSFKQILGRSGQLINFCGKTWLCATVNNDSYCTLSQIQQRWQAREHHLWLCRLLNDSTRPEAESLRMSPRTPTPQEESPRTALRTPPLCPRSPRGSSMTLALWNLRIPQSHILENSTKSQSRTLIITLTFLTLWNPWGLHKVRDGVLEVANSEI